MTKILALEDLTGTLQELLDTLSQGDEVILTRNQQPVAKLVAEIAKQAQMRPGPGLFKSLVTYVAPDFDASLDDLKEYM